MVMCVGWAQKKVFRLRARQDFRSAVIFSLFRDMEELMSKYLHEELLPSQPSFNFASSASITTPQIRK